MARKDISDFDVINAIKERQNGANGNNIEVLARMTGQPLKVAERAIERAERRNLIEVGTSIRYAWPLPEGERLYQANGGKIPPRPYTEI